MGFQWDALRVRRRTTSSLHPLEGKSLLWGGFHGDRNHCSTDGHSSTERGGLVTCSELPGPLTFADLCQRFRAESCVGNEWRVTGPVNSTPC